MTDVGEAARVDDPIYHTSALAGFLIELTSASPLSRLPPCLFSCGFLAGLILGFMADQIARNWAIIGAPSTTRQEKILTESPENVSTNSRPAARAVLSNGEMR